MLSRLGYAADLATNGREAIAALKKQHYDIVFMDIQMPALDGLRTTRIIHENCASNDQPYVIAITAYEDKYNWEMCENAGMDDFIANSATLDGIRNIMESFEEHLKKKILPLSMKSITG